MTSSEIFHAVGGGGTWLSKIKKEAGLFTDYFFVCESMRRLETQ